MRTCVFASLGQSLAFASLVLGVVRGVEQSTIYSGFLVDLYCYRLVENGGTGLDGTDVIRKPWEHTLHCLRDPRQCYDQFFVAVNHGEPTNISSGRPGDYHIKYFLDKPSNEKALALLRTYPVGSPRDHGPGNFLVTAVGTVNEDGIMSLSSISECTGPNCDSVCSGGCPDVEPDMSSLGGLHVLPLVWIHALCMVSSWGCLLPLGVAWAHGMRQHPKMFHGKPIWFVGHRTLQSMGVLLQFIGFAAIFAMKHAHAGSFSVHFKAPHEVVGVIVVVLGCWQPIQAQLRHFSCVGHPGSDGSRTQARKVWELAHKLIGILALLLGLTNIVLGMVYASSLSLGQGLVPIVATVFALSLLGIVVFGVIRTAKSQAKQVSDDETQTK